MTHVEFLRLAGGKAMDAVEIILVACFGIAVPIQRLP
jgi:hypothetical protein